MEHSNTKSLAVIFQMFSPGVFSQLVDAISSNPSGVKAAHAEYMRKPYSAAPFGDLVATSDEDIRSDFGLGMQIFIWIALVDTALSGTRIKENVQTIFGFTQAEVDSIFRSLKDNDPGWMSQIMSGMKEMIAGKDATARIDLFPDMAILGHKVRELMTLKSLRPTVLGRTIMQEQNDITETGTVSAATVRNTHMLANFAHAPKTHGLDAPLHNHVARAAEQGGLSDLVTKIADRIRARRLKKQGIQKSEYHDSRDSFTEEEDDEVGGPRARARRQARRARRINRKASRYERRYGESAIAPRDSGAQGSAGPAGAGMTPDVNPNTNVDPYTTPFGSDKPQSNISDDDLQSEYLNNTVYGNQPIMGYDE